MVLRLVTLAMYLSCTATLAGDDVYLQILGIAQDAGYPQANCYQPHCMRAWHDRSARRMASSIAVIDNANNAKYLFDATPDIRDQLFQLQRSAADADFPLNGIFLTHAHIGHYTGLMHFGVEASNSNALAVYAMPRMREFLSGNGPWDQLLRYGNVKIMQLEDDTDIVLSSALTITPFLVPHRDEYSETVGFRIQGPQKSAVYIPDIDKWKRWDTDILDVIKSVDFALLDATFYADGELPGRDMSKIPHPFATDSMALFSDLSAAEKARVIFIHFNHTNPLLIDGSPEQAEVRKRGFGFAREEMRLEL